MDATRYKIALVDDNLATLNQGKSLLQDTYKVYTMQAAATLFENLEKDIPDLILLDIEMPGMNGYETLAKLKDDPRYKDIPVIFLTGNADEESERRGLSLGVSDYITKHFSPGILKLRIQNQIRLIEQINTVQYEIMKYKLVSEAIDAALWDMNVLVDDPASPENQVTWSQELRHMIGFSDENDLPNTIEAFAARFHPDDRDMNPGC